MGHGKLYQTLTAVASGFGSYIMGLFYVWPSYTIPMFLAKNSTLLSAPMTETELSLIGSLPPLGAMLGTAAVGYMIDTFGRKMGGLALSLPFVLSWSIIGVTKSSLVVLIARFMGGFAGGANLVFAPIFISEVAEDSIRGTLASATIFFYGAGTLTSYMLGWFFSYNATVWINVAFSVLCCGLFLIVAESPIYLLKKNREEDARISLSIYRGVSPNSIQIQEEITRLKQQINPAYYEMVSVDEKPIVADVEKEKLQAEDLKLESPKKMAAIKTLFLTLPSRRAFFVVLSVISMQVMMGIVPVQVYAKQVFMQAEPSQADLYSVLFAMVLFGGAFVTGAVADKAGRRVLLITSSAAVAVCMATLGYLLLTKSAPAWVTVTMILLYCFCFMAGSGSIPYVLLAEVFNPEVQALASTLIMEWVWFLNFLILIIFKYLNSLIGIHGTFFIFSINATINAVLGFLIVPETKGLSNSQIQEAFLRWGK